MKAYLDIKKFLKAMEELSRVLKPGGWVSIQVPIKEDVTQEDHVRYYGCDFVNRLKDAGFDVLLVSKDDLLESDEMERIFVAVENEVILCRK